MNAPENIKGLKSKFGKYLFRVINSIIKLISYLPTPLCRLIVKQYLVFFKFFGKFISYFFKKEVNIAEIQLLFAKIAKNKNQAIMYSRNVFSEVAISFAETFLIGTFLQHPNLKKRYKIIINNEEEYINLIKNGAMLVSGHIGCFELLAAYTSLHSKLWIVGRYPNSPMLSGFLEELRNSYKGNALWRGGISETTKLVKAIKNGETLAFLIDQDITSEHEFVPFFGIEASHPVSLIKLALKNNANFMSVFIRRTGLLTHEIHFKRIDLNLVKTESLEEKSKKIIHEYNKNLEEIIKLDPSKWIWWHMRWRRRPNIDYKARPRKLKNSRVYRRWMKYIMKKHY